MLSRMNVFGSGTTEPDWKTKHLEVIRSFLKYLNTVSNAYILKDGTSLLCCYGLDRFSEDIDLDGFSGNFLNIVEGYISTTNYNYRIAKNTDTVKRVMIHYGGVKPLKVEVSYRLKNMDSNNITEINSILVYKIEPILVMKISAYANRDKLRDLYDVVFTYKNYWNEINPDILDQVAYTVSYKGLEQFDFLIKDQFGELIDNGKLAEDFLLIYDKLGCL